MLDKLVKIATVCLLAAYTWLVVKMGRWFCLSKDGKEDDED